MTTPIFDLVTGRETLEELTDHVARMTKQLNFMMNKNLSSRNIREIGNWVVGSDYFRSRDGQVGISSAGTSGDSIRFWAGSSNPASAPWRVTHSGQMVASNANITGIVTATGGFIGGWSILPDRLSGSGIIEGGIIRTSSTGRRLELSGSSLKSMNNLSNDGFVLDAQDGNIKLYTGNSLTGFMGRATSPYGYEALLISHSYVQIAGNPYISLDGSVIYIGDINASIYLKGMTALGIYQPNSTATDINGLRNDFNLLLSNLRSMGILS